MSDIKWYGSGIYSRQRDGREVFYGRVWISTQKRMRYSKLRARSIEEARERLGALKADPEKFFTKRDTKPAPKALSLDAIVDRFLGTYKAKGGTADYYEGGPAGSWKAHFGKTISAEKITRAMVEDYRDAMKSDDYSDSTIRKYITNLGTLYRWAIRRGLIQDSPALAWSRKGDGIARPKEPKRPTAVLSRESEVKLLEAADVETRIAIRLFIESGMRQGETDDATEALTLRWGQVVDDRILIHKSKTREGRSIPINGRLRAVLDDCLANLRSDILRRDIQAGKAPDAYVLSDGSGNPLDGDRLWRRIESAMGRAGVVKPAGSQYNLFRHTFGSRLAEAGVSFGVIARLMGNTAAIAERFYIDFSPKHLRGAMAMLDAPTVAGSVADGRIHGVPGPADQRQAVGA